MVLDQCRFSCEDPSVATRTPIIEVNFKRCANLARLLRDYEIPVDRENASLPGFSQLEVGNFYLFVVAICHQTSAPGKPPLEGRVHGQYAQGWDYLVARSEVFFSDNRNLLVPENWMNLTGQQIEELYRDPEYGERLSDPDHRAVLIRDIGIKLTDRGWTGLEDLYRACDGRIATGFPNLLEDLAVFRAYADPVRKKSYFLLSIMRNSGLWCYVDEELLGPPVDYHEVRGHLRIGTVVVSSPELRRKLMESIPVEASEDIAIRTAVHDAIMYLSGETRLRNPSQLHYLFWNVFRACCTRENPHCQACPQSCTLPDSYVPLAQSANVRRCPFVTECASASVKRRYVEHVFETEYY
jgi:hypothetical protein